MMVNSQHGVRTEGALLSGTYRVRWLSMVKPRCCRENKEMQAVSLEIRVSFRVRCLLSHGTSGGLIPQRSSLGICSVLTVCILSASAKEIRGEDSVPA